MKRLILFLILTALFYSTPLTITEYEQLQLETPQILFETVEIAADSNREQSSATTQRLIFTTPWNIHGGDLVIKHAHKFKYVSPCWYDLSFSSDHIIIENDKLYNATFLALLKQANPKIKILPRFYIASNQQALLHSIGSFQVKFKQAIGLIVTLIENQNFDGLVWDSPFNTMIAGQKYQSIRNLIVQFVNSIRMNLYPQRLLFFNMGNPMGLQLANQMYSILQVDCILIQNYDNDKYLQMLDSSISWIKSNKFTYKPKFMLLLPFFSRRGGQGIDTRQIQKLYDKQEEKLGFRIENGICVVYEYAKRMQSFVPCFHYFNKAFKKAAQQGYKIGFWEAGNGLENYYQFL